jgi:VanZ family protein
MKILNFYNMKKIWLILFIIWTLLIILLSVMPYSKEVVSKNGSSFRWDYLEHFVAYFAFASLYILWRSDRNFSIRKLELFLMFAVIISFSLLTEYIQLLVPGRTFNYVDVAYNFVGVLGSFLIVCVYLIRYYMRRKHSVIEI